MPSFILAGHVRYFRQYWPLASHPWTAPIRPIVNRIIQICSENFCLHHVITTPTQTVKHSWVLQNTEAVVQKCSMQRIFIKTLQNPQKHLWRSFFLIRWHAYSLQIYCKRDFSVSAVIVFAFAVTILLCGHIITMKTYLLFDFSNFCTLLV